MSSEVHSSELLIVVFTGVHDAQVDLTPRQCHGIDCVNTARVSSKYCSDQCGLSLASLRIYQTLPERIR